MSFRYQQGDRPLAGYTIQRGVGRGGFGEVYYATSDGGKEVALKHLRENPQVELRGTGPVLNLKSPHLVSIHDVKETPQGEFFVIMEFVNGPSLRDLMTDSPGGLGPQKAAYFAREIAKGLAYLHDRGIVHRDVKPGNIFYEDGYVKIGDYGLAKIMAASQHSGQTVSVGTVHYMAPEVGSGNYDRTIDVYALGVIIYEMLMGKVPFSGSSMGEVLMKHLTAQPEVDELPAPFPQVIRKALAKDPKDRYATVNDLVADLFSEEDLSKSVASFEPQTLSMRANRAGEALRPANVGPAVAFGTGSSNMGETLAAPPPIIQQNRFDDRAAPARGGPPPLPAGYGGPHRSPSMAHDGGLFAGSFGQIGKKIGLCLFVCLGLSAVSTAIAGQNEDFVAANFGLSVLIVAAIYLGNWIALRGKSEPGNWWPRILSAMGIAIPLFIMSSQSYRNEFREYALAIGITVILCDWVKRLREGRDGSVSLNMAFSAGLCALIAALIFDAEPVIVVAVLVAGASICTQVLAPLWPRELPPPEDEYDDESVDEESSAEGWQSGDRVQGAVGIERMGGAIRDRFATVQGNSSTKVCRSVYEERSGLVRFGWTLGAFASLTAMLACFIIPNAVRTQQDVWAACITGGVMLASIFLICVSCAIPRQKRGLWRGVIRKAIFFGGIGIVSASGTAMGLEYELGLPDEGMVALIIAMIVGGLATIFVWFIPMPEYQGVSVPVNSEADKNDKEKEVDKARLARGLRIVGFICLGAGLFALPILLVFVDDRHWDELLPIIYVPLSLVTVVLMGLSFIVGRKKQEKRDLTIPMHREIQLDADADLSGLLRRFAAMYDYHLKESGDMYWRFVRGAWVGQFSQANIRRWGTKLNIAAFPDSGNGLLVRCMLDVENTFSQPNSKNRRFLADELDDLERVLLGASSMGGVGIERNEVRARV